MVWIAGLGLLNGVARSEDANPVRTFSATGVVRQLGPEPRTVVIQHEAISNYMDAMTMPFHVRTPNEVNGLQAGDQISFRLHVNATESWIDGITRLGHSAPRNDLPAATPAVRPHHPLRDYAFTNELGMPVSLAQFQGQALAITFFYTRCPIPEYCPRLSKNFQEAARRLSARADGPTNWHFLSVSFDPEADTPRVLKAYGEALGYDPAHWSFVTGPADKIAELAAQSDVSTQREGSFLNHNFRTLIVDATGRLQMVFPTTGDLSDSIVTEILKAAAATNAVATAP